MFESYRTNMVQQLGLDHLYDQVSESLAMVAQSHDYIAGLTQRHSDRGAFRSGMGDASAVYERE